MPVSEFELIRRFFADATGARADVLLGIGDDCALLSPPPGMALAVSIDTLVAGCHFLDRTDPEGLGHKALAANLSDLAAVGAEPAWATLSLTLPQADPDWLTGFMAGFSALAARYDVQLVGGDTTRGPLSITVQVHGFVDHSRALRRAGGRAGDRLFLSGTVGDAALALEWIQNGTVFPPGAEFLRERLDRPQPRVELGRLLAGRASAAIDVSDGLAADLGHICEASALGAVIELARLPLSAPVAAECARGNWRHPLAGGDDYELLFSVDPSHVDRLLADCRSRGHAVQEIGRLVDEEGIALVHPDGRVSKEIPHGFDHFGA